MLPSGQFQFFDNEEIFKWSYDILRALKYLRNKCIVHRDVKPQYVIIFLFNLNKRRRFSTVELNILQ
jgi:serine/threonine protein kinase